MAFDLQVSGGKTAQVTEPTRDLFPDNLGGAVEFSLAHLVYRVLEIMGGALGAFGAGVLVQFLDVVEPALINYARPLIDMMLDAEGLPEPFRAFFQQLREPPDAAAAALLAGVGTQAGGAVVGSFISSLMAPVTHFFNRQIRPARAGPGETVSMMYRGTIDQDLMTRWLADQGYNDRSIEGFVAILTRYPEAGALIDGYLRGVITQPYITDQLTRQGYHQDTIDLMMATIQRFMPVADDVAAMMRGLKDETVVRADMHAQGLGDDDIEVMLQLARWIPNPQDLIRMAVREAWRDDVAAAWGYDEEFPDEFGYWLDKQGGSPEWAKRYWRAHWVIPSVTMGYEMLHRGEIDLETLRTMLKLSDIPEYWRDRLIATAYTPLTRVDVRRMYGLGVLDTEGVKRAYTDIGYDDVNADRMTEFTTLYEDDKGGNKLEEYKALTRSLVEQAFVKGIMDRPEAAERLGALGYAVEDIDIIVEMAEMRKMIATAPDFMKEYQKDVRSIVERSYARRLIDLETASDYLEAVGYAESEAEFLLGSIEYYALEETRNREVNGIGESYVKGAIDYNKVIAGLGSLNIPHEMQTLLLGEWESTRKTRHRRITEAQARKALKTGLMTVDGYIEHLVDLGYAEKDIPILVGLAEGSE